MQTAARPLFGQIKMILLSYSALSKARPKEVHSKKNPKIGQRGNNNHLYIQCVS